MAWQACPEQHDGVEVDVRVQERQRQAGQQHRDQPGRAVLRRCHARRLQRAACRQRAVDEQKSRATDLGEGDGVGVGGDDRADTGDARGDEQQIRDRAHADHCQDVLTSDALAQHERVLGADRCDQGEGRQESDEQGRGHTGDGRKVLLISPTKDTYSD